MAIIDRIKFEGAPETLVWKFPKDNIVKGAQLIVNESQEAVFFKDGQALDIFGPGAHTLDSSNIPLLQKIVNLPFGGETPFSAEVIFVNKVAKLDYKWGTKSPIIIEDPRYRVFLSVGAFGQFGLKIIDSRLFITQIVGTMPEWTSTSVLEYFKGLITTKVKDIIANYSVRQNISIVQLNAFLDDLSKLAETAIREEFNRFGIEVLNFYLTSIDIPDEEKRKIQEGQFQRLQMDQLGDDRYQRMRSFDVLENAANNPGTTGTLMGAGLGLGMGAQMMHQANAMNQSSGMQQAAQPVAPKGIFCSKCGTALSSDERFCHKCGSATGPALCPHCNNQLKPEANFCASCGKPVGV
jgi:membrane protease subunit (stomatin/prohibitin family)